MFRMPIINNSIIKVTNLLLKRMTIFLTESYLAAKVFSLVLALAGSWDHETKDTFVVSSCMVVISD